MVVAFYPGILPFVFSPEHQAHPVLKLVKIRISFEPCFLSWLAVSITTWSSASHSLKILLLAPTLLFFPCLCEFVLEKNKIFFFFSVVLVVFRDGTKSDVQIQSLIPTQRLHII